MIDAWRFGVRFWYTPIRFGNWPPKYSQEQRFFSYDAWLRYAHFLFWFSGIFASTNDFGAGLGLLFPIVGFIPYSIGVLGEKERPTFDTQLTT
ncbi:hypothetical protein K458DRAFT_175943 [Lentithecium fluviatile CBS 122367]|uniref:Uncharacterized protein n=1 Tax=Lentithecium fluviatile CBS 122367 TaxID=1168545 RepID=A0A6G1JDG0_9PLEO|nr:hypothetical protein K458DRAFT_175943 [Lentithecium fluviatile CBS 122367]